MRRHIRSATAHYALIQGLYWAVYCLMVAFASVFLLDRGFTNSQIGSVLGLSYLFSALLQPLLAAFFLRRGIRLNRGVAAIYALVVLAALIVRFLPMERLPLAALMVGLFTMQSALQPSVNSLSQAMEAEGERVNFGMARGVGSAAYAISSFLMGRLLARFAPSILPLSYAAASAALAAALLTARTRADAAGAVRGRGSASYAAILRARPMIALFLGGVACMFLTYSFIEAFLLQIIVSKGGDSGSLGSAITLSAMTELPAMIIFSHFSRKGMGLKLLLAAVWFWLLRDILTLIAPGPGALYAVQLLNFVSVAVYVPGMMDYMRHALPEDQLLLGATMAGTAATLGSLAATFAGGRMIDALGVHGALAIAVGFAACGAALLTAALISEQRRGPASAAQ